MAGPGTILRRRCFHIAGALAATALLCCSCVREQPPSQASATLVRDIMSFGLCLYGTLRSQPGNIFIAPYPAAESLAMVYAGARGNTATQICAALDFTLDPLELASAFGETDTRLRAAARANRIELTMAVGPWAHDDYPFLDTFTRVIRNRFKADLGMVDFVATEAARNEINEWVDARTDGRIENMIGPGVLTDEMRLILVSAAYLSAAWEQPFSVGATVYQPFSISPTRKTDAAMMKRVCRARYMETDSFQALELPYAGGRMAMVALLPRKHDGLAALELSLAAETLVSWLNSLQQAEVEVLLPRFEFDFQADLSGALAAMGMTDAFDAKAADFFGINGRGMLYLSRVLHRARIEVTESGTASVVATGSTSAASKSTEPPAASARFIADHPFLFFIWDRGTGSILFIGRVIDPTV